MGVRDGRQGGEIESRSTVCLSRCERAQRWPGERARRAYVVCRGALAGLNHLDQRVGWLVSKFLEMKSVVREPLRAAFSQQFVSL